MRKDIFKNIKVEELIKSMESKFFNVFKRYDLGNLNISLSYIKKPGSLTLVKFKNTP